MMFGEAFYGIKSFIGHDVHYLRPVNYTTFLIKPCLALQILFCNKMRKHGITYAILASDDITCLVNVALNIHDFVLLNLIDLDKTSNS